MTAVPEPTARPVFPTPGPVGVLTDGPIFSEPAKYLVIDGESDLHYVYDANGEFVCCFNAEYSDDPDYSSEAGLYTAYQNLNVPSKDSVSRYFEWQIIAHKSNWFKP